MSVNSPSTYTPPAPSSGSSAVGALLGAHVSIRGGIELAPERAKAIGAEVIQVFTKTPNRWNDPEVDPETGARFRQAVARQRLRGIVAHDSYLINLASPDSTLRSRSINGLVSELERCQVLGIPYLVSHPGNYIDSPERGLTRNAEGCTEALFKADSETGILLETTAGTGTALGATFEQLADLRSRIDSRVRSRVGVCLDTCHIFAAGYDLVGEYDRVIEEFDAVVGLEWLRCIHLNDSRFGLGSRRDRHAEIGRGALGPGPFKRIMRDHRLAPVMKVLETPKGDDEVSNDRKALTQLRAWGSQSPARRHR